MKELFIYLLKPLCLQFIPYPFYAILSMLFENQLTLLKSIFCLLPTVSGTNGKYPSLKRDYIGFEMINKLLNLPTIIFPDTDSHAQQPEINK